MIASVVQLQVRVDLVVFVKFVRDLVVLVVLFVRQELVLKMSVVLRGFGGTVARALDPALSVRLIHGTRVEILRS